MHHVRWDRRADAAANASARLPQLISWYFEYVRRHLVKDPEASKLHRLRLATKRVRYTLELFRPCYGPGFETRIAGMRQVQQRLGDVNDCVASRAPLLKAMDAVPQRTQVEEFLEARSAAAVQKFRKYWTEEFDAPGREVWWTGYLRRAASSKTARRLR